MNDFNHCVLFNFLRMQNGRVAKKKLKPHSLLACEKESFSKYLFRPGFFLKCLFSGLEEGPVSLEGEKNFYPDLFFLELLVVPPCRYSANKHILYTESVVRFSLESQKENKCEQAGRDAQSE